MIVGPLIAALDAATMTKSFPVMPSSTSLDGVRSAFKVQSAEDSHICKLAEN